VGMDFGASPPCAWALRAQTVPLAAAANIDKHSRLFILFPHLSTTTTRRPCERRSG
jgi:hypothetical protein